MVNSTPTPAAKLSFSQRLIIVGLLALQVLSGIILYPVAAVLVLTGILAPISIVLFRIGTLPLSLALKLKASWQGGRGDSVEYLSGTANVTVLESG